MDSQDLNIAIIGGGPTGLVTAILLSRIGVPSTVFEQHDWPIDKVCGEGILPPGVLILKKYNLLQQINPDWITPFDGIRYISGSRSAFGTFPNEKGLVIRRTALSQGLWKAASLEDKISLRPKCCLQKIDEQPDSVNIIVKDLQTHSIETLTGFTYLIGADGLRSKVKTLTGLHGTSPGVQKKRFGARVHFELSPWDSKVQVLWKDGVEAYIVPISKNCTEVVFGWDQEMINPLEQKLGIEEGLFSYFPELKNKTIGARKLSTFKSWGPLPHRAKSPLVGRVALIGDAGLFYDSITGEGLSLAFAQAELVANTITEWHTPKGRAAFINQIGKIAKTYIQVTNLAMFFTRHSYARKLAIWLLARSPQLFSHLLQVNMGQKSLLKPPMRLILQALFFPKAED